MICILIITLIGICPCTRNESSTSWAMACGGTGDDFCRWGSTTSDGGYILTGFCNSFNTNSDILLVKLNASGIVAWSKTIGGVYHDSAFSVVETPDGGYILSGWMNLGTTDVDGLIIKLNSSGDIEWAKTFGNPGAADPDRAYLTVPTSDGGCIVSGHTYSGPSAAENSIILKLNNTGRLMWSRIDIVSGSWSTRAWAVDQTFDNGYIVTGYTGFVDHTDILVKKLDTLGNIIWKKTYGLVSPYWDAASTVEQTLDGGYIIAASSGLIGTPPYFDATIMKLDDEGDLTWVKNFGGNSFDVFFGASQTSDGGYIATGYTQSFGAGNSDILIIKLDASGNAIWSKTFGGAGNDYAYTAFETMDGRYIIAGATESFGAGGFDFLAIKLETDGTIEGSCTPLRTCTPTETIPAFGSDTIMISLPFDDPMPEATQSVASVAVTENTICGVIGIEQELTETNISSSYIFPHPVTNKAIIKYEVKKDADVLIKVYSQTGTVVKILVNKKMSRGLYTVTWDGTDNYGSKVSAGSYFCVIKTDGVTTRKVVYVK